MRWFHSALVALVLVACGGAASRSPSSSPESAGGSAGEPSSGAGAAPSDAAGGGSGTGAVAGGVAGADGQAAGMAGIAAGAAGEAGAGGGPPLTCVGAIDCLYGEEVIYVPDRAWQRPPAGATMTSELSEADYQPLVGPTWRAKFSNDGQKLDLTPTAGGETVHGTRDASRTDRAWFELTLFAGGRFVVGEDLGAEYTAYGSGMPIVSSTRGSLERQ